MHLEKKMQKPEEEPLPTYKLDVHDSGYADKFAFSPSRNVYVYMPPNTTELSERGLFELYFSDYVVAEICRCSDQ